MAPHPEPPCDELADAIGGAVVRPASVPPPAPAVRGARLLAAGDRGWTRLDAFLSRTLPSGLDPAGQLGPAANAMLVVATVSGVLLLLWYSPSVQDAWASLAALPPWSVGGLTRSVHRYSSDLAMLLVLAHAARTLLGRKFADARWLAWVTGGLMLGVTWFIGWTGYWLVWDVRAQAVAQDSLKVLDVLPVFGEPLAPLLASDRTVPSLLFFVVFFLHMLLPLGLAAGLGLHVARLSRARLWPDRRLLGALGAAVATAAVLWPATSAEPARMALQPESFAMDWWYLAPLAVTRRLSGGGVWFAALLAAGLWLGVPWWLARRRPRSTFQAAVNPARCFGCTLCTRDCPFDAIAMVPRTDGKPFPGEARVDPDRCVGCGVCVGACDTQGIDLAWIEARPFAAAREAEATAGAAAGRPVAFAFVCAQGDGGVGDFDVVGWARRLPGYAVHPVPCSGWIEPKLVEKLIARGARAVLVVGCGSGEPAAREGHRWLQARLAGTREPAFRPARADPRKVAAVKFDPTRPQDLAAAATRLLTGEDAVTPAPRRRWWAGALVAPVLAALVLPPSTALFRDPAPAAPEFVLVFRAHGAWLEGTSATPAAADPRPVHMRAPQPARRARHPVTVVVAVDGVERSRVFAPKGWSRDGAAAGEWRIAVPPGVRHIAVSLHTGRAGGPPSWAGEFAAAERRRHVLRYDGAGGFTWEP